MRAPFAHRPAHAASVPPCGAAEERLAGGDGPRDRLVGPAIVILLGCARARVEEAHQALIDRRLPHDLRARQPADARDQRNMAASWKLGRLVAIARKTDFPSKMLSIESYCGSSISSAPHPSAEARRMSIVRRSRIAQPAPCP